jgi:hypothetical protein
MRRAAGDALSSWPAERAVRRGITRLRLHKVLLGKYLAIPTINNIIILFVKNLIFFLKKLKTYVSIHKMCFYNPYNFHNKN